MLLTQHIYLADNLRKLPELPDDSIDLIYIDPPFNTGRDYEIIWREVEERRAFDDRFGDIDNYIGWIRDRAAHLRRVLKPTGSFFFHCDPHANYAIRRLMQDELGMTFQSEIVWRRSGSHGGAKRPAPVHDTIFFFTKGKRYTWNQILEPLPEETANEWYNNIEEGTGRRFNRDNLTAAGRREGESGTPWRNIDPTRKNRHWSIPRSIPDITSIVEGLGTIEALEALDAANRIHWPKKRGGAPMLKRYLEEAAGVPIADVWNDIPQLHNRAPERVGWPTQKPVALLERIVAMASNPGDVVLDAFCGCGTALVAAQKLGRKWIGIDASPTAVQVMARRLERDCHLTEAIGFFVRSMKTDVEHLRSIPPRDFENWAVSTLGGIPNLVKVNDKGIDGRLYLAGANLPKPAQTLFAFARAGVAKRGEQTDMFAVESIPVQAKQRDKSGRGDIDAFETALRRDGKTTGIIVAFGFTRGAMQEIRRAKRAEGLNIIPLTVAEILDAQAA